MDQESLFNECMQQARLALEEKEVAIGCVFYQTDSKVIIAKGRNSVNASKNATRHAEMNCIDDTLIYCQQNDLDPKDVWPKVEVYVTCEPCIMCARMLRHLGVSRVIYGCSNDRFGGCRSVFDVASCDKIDERSLEYVHGVKESEAIHLLKVFYSGENLNAPEEIRKAKKMRVSL